MIASLLASFALLAQEPSGKIAPFDAAKTITASVLEEELDKSLHWLRSRFDPAKGSYGSLEEDAWALLALAASPRRYRPSEGPFFDQPLARIRAAQQPDGSFGNEALDLVATRALAVLANKPVEWHGTGMGPDALQASAKKILLARRTDGSFGSLIETARELDRLSWCQAELKSAEPKKGSKEAKLVARSDEPQHAAIQPAMVDEALTRGARFLLSQRVDGGFGFDGHRDAGITAMAVGALYSVPEPRPAPVQAALTEGLDFLAGLQKDDGSIHEGQLANYITSAAILALAKGGREADKARIQRASAFLKALQADEGEGYSAGDRYYGGVGYGGDERPDLSNLQMALEALHTAGTPASDPAFQKALTFLQRCQNRSESNDLVLVSDGKTFGSGNDGGASYAPGESKAGFVTLADGKQVARSYGSMSYALLKGYLFAGLSKDDARVQAVWKWLRENYTLDVNPGFQASDDPTASYQGLFYYFYTMAKALDLFGEPALLDAAGREHDWRSELCGRLAALQRQDGSWVNENAARWFEGNPVLATSYAMLTLGTARGAQ